MFWHGPSGRMSELGRCCRKSRKSNDAKNLANVDFWTTEPLRCSLMSIRRSVVVFLRSDVVPSRRCARNASAALENFVCYPQKTFSAASTQLGHDRPSFTAPYTRRAHVLTKTRVK